tara:strand:- start:1949 stop:2638 length:690 start_codon:yes stop_codon:yes gene_type:complete
LANHGIASRRKVEEMISAGRITINGKLANIGDRASISDKILVDGRQIALDAVETVLLMYHKPEGQICTHDDPQDRPTVYEALPEPPQGRWISIGRLDFNTQGLLLFTNNGELANQWMHPSANIEREYLVRVRGQITPDILARLEKGVMLDDGFAQCKIAEKLREDQTKQNQWLRLVITEGRNREVRRLMEACDLKVSQLKRIRFGHLSLPKSLPVGQTVQVPEKKHQPR